MQQTNHKRDLVVQFDIIAVELASMYSVMHTVTRGVPKSFSTGSRCEMHGVGEQPHAAIDQLLILRKIYMTKSCCRYIATFYKQTISYN